MAVVVAQLAEQALPAPEVNGSLANYYTEHSYNSTVLRRQQYKGKGPDWAI